MERDRPGAGVLVLTVWCEDLDREVRARITSTLDVTRPGGASGAARGVDSVVELVEEWLRSYAAGACRDRETFW